MLPKTSFLIPLALLIFSGASAQFYNLDENSPAVQDGIEYGYSIKNEQVKNAKGEDYSRYELTLYVTNKSGCTRLFADRISFQSSDAPNLLATFNCSNANGKRLTSKGGTVRVRDFFVNARMREGDRDVNRSVKAGYIFRNGETVSAMIIVLVPLGERPMMSFMPNNLQELR